MTNKRIVQRIAKSIDLSETKIDVVLESFFDILVKEVANGNKVVIKDYFTFYESKTPACVKNLKEEQITERIRANKYFDESDNTLLVPEKISLKMKMEKYASVMFKQIVNKKRGI